MMHDQNNSSNETVEHRILWTGSPLFRAALDAIGEAVIITNVQLDKPGPIIDYVNPAFSRMSGYSAQEVIGRTPRILQGPLTERAVLDRLRSDLEEREHFQGTIINYRKNGTTYLLHWHITPLRDQAGKLTHWVALQREIKSDGEGDEQLEDGLHRVRHITNQAAARIAGMVQPTVRAGHPSAQYNKNGCDLQTQVRDVLATVRSIARRTAENYPAAEEYAMHLDGRIGALARLKNATLQTSRNILELGWLVTQELLPFDMPGENRVRIKGPEVYLEPQIAETIGLGIHELATNALKFGALSRSGGSVSVNWRVKPHGEMPQIILKWTEIGAPEMVTISEHKGFGLNYLEQIMPRKIGATASLKFLLAGMIYEISIPLSDKTSANH